MIDSYIPQGYEPGSSGRFSETGGPGPRLDKTRRHVVHRRSRVPEIARGPADDVGERPAEAAEAGETHRHADVGDRRVGRAKQVHGPFDPTALEVAVRRLAERTLERTDERRLGHAGDRREGVEIQGAGEVAVHRVAGPEQPPVGVLGVRKHRAIQPSRRSGRGSRRLLRDPLLDPQRVPEGVEQAQAVPTRHAFPESRPQVGVGLRGQFGVQLSNARCGHAHGSTRRAVAAVLGQVQDEIAPRHLHVERHSVVEVVLEVDRAAQPVHVELARSIDVEHPQDRHRCAEGDHRLPLLPVGEQPDGLVDPSLSGVRRLGRVDVVDVVPLQAVGQPVEELSRARRGVQRVGEVRRHVDGARGVIDGQLDLDAVSGLETGLGADRGTDADHRLSTHHANRRPVLVPVDRDPNGRTFAVSELLDHLGRHDDPRGLLAIGLVQGGFEPNRLTLRHQLLRSVRRGHAGEMVRVTTYGIPQTSPSRTGVEIALEVAPLRLRCRSDLT